MRSQIGADSPVGRVIFQPRLRREDGGDCWLDALLGKGFAIVGKSASSLPLSQEAKAILLALGAVTVDTGSLALVEGIPDPLLESCEAALVRPDRMVFGVVDEAHDLSALVIELGRMLALTVD